MEPTVSWSDEKNDELIKRYGFGFERVLVALAEDGFLDDREHTNTVKYGNQRQLVVCIENYAYIVPYVEDDVQVFFKTMFPSRKATKQYLHHE